MDEAAEAAAAEAQFSDLVGDDNTGSLDDAQLEEQFQAAVRAGQEIEMEAEAPAKRSRMAAGSRTKRSTSILNESTIWFGKTPLVLRTDLAATWI